MQTVPLYLRLANTLLKEITERRLRPGDRLPTEDELIRNFGVSRVTVRQALDVLRHRHLIERFARRGSFVAQAPAMSVWTLNFIEDVVQAGAETEVHVRDWKVVRVVPAITRHLALAESRVYRLRGTRSSDSVPLYDQQIYMPVGIGRQLERDDLSRTTVLELLENKLGMHLIRAVEEISAGVAGPGVARRLRMQAGAATLMLELTYFASDGRPVVYVQAQYPADRFRRRNELTRRSTAGLMRPLRLAESEHN